MQKLSAPMPYQKFTVIIYVYQSFARSLTWHCRATNNIGLFLTDLLNPLSQNDLVIKYSFDVIKNIRETPCDLFHAGYIFEFLTWSLRSLLANVSFERAINIILDDVYKKKLVTTQVKKRTQKKLIKDTCSKTIFTANNQMHQQVDGASMGSSLGPFLLREWRQN